MKNITNELERTCLEHTGKVSDKWSIYIDVYDRLFSSYRNHPLQLFEIGVQNGGSLELWAKYFRNAKKFVGCDINPDCERLIFDDPRIVVVGVDVNTDEAYARIIKHSPCFDLMIDDGSHQSRDIVRSFVRYFPHINEGGIYVAEDLHCSYWREFDGGIYHPFSSIKFFKQLVDVINHEHWGIDQPRSSVLAEFNDHYQVAFTEDVLAQIHSVEFVNSMCIVRKMSADKNILGARVICGVRAEVDSEPVSLSGSFNKALNQTENQWSLHPDNFRDELAADAKEISELKQAHKAIELEYGKKLEKLNLQFKVNLESQLNNKRHQVDKLLGEMKHLQLEKDIQSQLVEESRRVVTDQIVQVKSQIVNLIKNDR